MEGILENTTEGHSRTGGGKNTFEEEMTEMAVKFILGKSVAVVGHRSSATTLPFHRVGGWRIFNVAICPTGHSEDRKCIAVSL